MKKFNTITIILFALCHPLHSQTSNNLLKLPFEIPENIYPFSFNIVDSCLNQEDYKYDKYNQKIISDEGQCEKTGKWYYYIYMASINQSTYYLGNYVSGKKEGKWVKYTIDGFNNESYISGVDWYKEDFLMGNSYRFRPSGEIGIEIEFVDGKIDGLVRFYSSKGVLLGIYKYENNVLSEIIYYNDINDLFQPKITGNYYPFALTEKNNCKYYNILMSRAKEPMCRECCD